MSTQPRMVRLLQCTRRSCQKVFPDDETVVKPGSTWLACPHCAETRSPAPTTRIQPDGRSVFNSHDHVEFDLNTLPAIPVHPKAGMRVKEGIAALVRWLTGEKPAGPEWVQSMSVCDLWHLDTATIQLTVGRVGKKWKAKDMPGSFPTREAAQSAAIARAVELVEGTLAILKP